MYSEQRSYHPNKMFINFNLDDIKHYLLSNSNFINIRDFGSIIIAESDDYLLTVNHIGKVKLQYNALKDRTIKKIIYEIENTFRKNISDFSLVKQEIYH